MLKVENSIELKAPPWRVWKALTKLEDYSRWHPFIRSGGEPAMGAEVDYLFRNRAFRKTFSAKAMIIRYDEPAAFGWRIGLGRLVSLDETFAIAAGEQGSILTHRITGNGVFAWFRTRFFQKRFHDIILATDQALERHMRGAGSPPTRPGNRRKRRIAQSRARHASPSRGSSE